MILKTCGCDSSCWFPTWTLPFSLQREEDADEYQMRGSEILGSGTQTDFPESGLERIFPAAAEKRVDGD